MNILFLEDRGASESPVNDWLQEEGHHVLDAFNPADAQSIWDNRTVLPIDCIIVDLNMPADGLTDGQKERSHGGVLSGWVWLKDICVPITPVMPLPTASLRWHPVLFGQE